MDKEKKSRERGREKRVNSNDGVEGKGRSVLDEVEKRDAIAEKKGGFESCRRGKEGDEGVEEAVDEKITFWRSQKSRDEGMGVELVNLFETLAMFQYGSTNLNLHHFFSGGIAHLDRANTFR